MRDFIAYEGTPCTCVLRIIKKHMSRSPTCIYMALIVDFECVKQTIEHLTLMFYKHQLLTYTSSRQTSFKNTIIHPCLCSSGGIILCSDDGTRFCFVGSVLDIIKCGR